MAAALDRDETSRRLRRESVLTRDGLREQPGLDAEGGGLKLAPIAEQGVEQAAEGCATATMARL